MIASGAKLRVLVVDDEPAILRFLRTGLSAQGFAVSEVGTGLAAMDAIAQQAADVVVLDLGLPDMDGLQVIGRVRDAGSVMPIIVLRMLVAHAGKVLTHKQILREVWGGDTDVQYLRIYVRALRQKIEPDPERPIYILTETGVGYRLRAPD